MAFADSAAAVLTDAADLKAGLKTLVSDMVAGSDEVILETISVQGAAGEKEASVVVRMVAGVSDAIGDDLTAIKLALIG